MYPNQVAAGFAIVGVAVLACVSSAGMDATAGASPPVVIGEQDSPTITIEPAPSAPSSDFSGDTGASSSTDSGSGIPSTDSSVGGPVADLPAGAPPIDPEATPDQGADAPPIPDALPPGEGPPGPPGGPAPTAPPGTPPDPDAGDGGKPPDCHRFWCPHPPVPPMPPDPPGWPWPDPFWPSTSDTWEPGTTVALPSPCVIPPPPNAPSPQPIQYGGQTVAPVFDGGLQQWGFWYLGNWVPMFGPDCPKPAP